jgi:hypothetical protein
MLILAAYNFKIILILAAFLKAICPLLNTTSIA